MDELLTEFLTETSEALAVIDNELVRFEQDPSDKSILQDIFRLVHTIKGTSGFLGLPRLESVTHAGEDVLGMFRDGALEVTPVAVSLILKAIDRVKDIIAGLEESGSEPAGDDSGLIAELRAIADGEAAQAAAAAAPAAPTAQAQAPAAPARSAPPTDPDGGFPVAQELLDEVSAAGAADAGVPTHSAGGFPVAQELLDEVAAAGASDAGVPTDAAGGFPVAQELLDEVAAAGADGAPQAAHGTGVPTEGLPASRQAAAAPAAASAEAAPAEPAPAAPAEKPAAAAAEGDEPRQAKESSIAAQSVRVNVQLLENLMTLVGELVLTRNQLLQMVRGRDDSEFKVPLQRLNHITTDVQEGVMKTRMQPIQNAWAKLPRIVRDLAVEMEKKIELKMLGGDTELDRQVLELIKDPLTHMVRNSADHGLETTDGRLEAGKPETGVITLNAYHEGGHIIIEISDDGRGVDIEKVKANIVKKELATAAELAEMSDQQIMQFIFKPGFSTAEKVTSVSGRGVGMDVVRTNIEKIGGNVELSSQPGKGSRFKINIPLTLAIVSALIVESGGERFAIPQIGVLELVRVSDNSENRIETINDVPVLRLRDRLLPLVDLPKLQKLRNPGDEGSEISERYVVVSQVGTFIFGLIVDRVFDTEEIVVKPVAPILRQIPIYSGNTILGDGSVIMILDVNGIASSAGAVDIPSQETQESDGEASGSGGERVALLVFRAAGSELRAVPLALVSRLEIIEGSRIEFAHGAAMVQYRERLMPLIATDGSQITADGQKNLLVFQEGDRAAGLVVEEIVDIVEEQLKVELTADQPGLVGTAVIDGKATDVLDVGHYLTQAFPDWFKAADVDRKYEGARKRMLLVDDSPFFRNLMAPLFSVAGYEVVTAGSADAALKMRDDGADFDVIISDIEMPGTDGFQFAERVRSDPRWRDVPMVALSSRASERDRERGRAVGFDDYVAKFDRNKVLDSLNRDFHREAELPTEKVA
jgi:two-component system, chemotaxis family, sensor kinase CheA